MKHRFHSFSARLTAVFLLIVLFLGTAFILITYRSVRYLYDDVEQLLNRGYAESIARELRPLLDQDETGARLRSAIHYMMVLNPRVEIYLLDEAGRILAYFAEREERIVRESVDTAPIRRFIEEDPAGLVLGEDPRDMARRRPFSAAPLSTGGGEGYVYVILGGERYETSLRVIRESYLVRITAVSLVLTLAAATAVGLTLFFLLTRRLRTLRGAVQALRRGELSRRIESRGTDELADLGRSFNEMAEAIEAGVRRLQHSERLRRQLVADISHDLRSPLTSIQGYIETILYGDPAMDETRRTRFLELSLANTAALRRLVDELLELSRFEARQVRPECEQVQIAELVQDVVLKLTPQAERAGVRIVPDRPPELPLVYADLGLIERVLTNLLENAVRCSPPGGEARVTLTAEDSSVRVTVADTGPGISEEDLPRIFDRFFRSDRSRPRPGAGLGLAIAREIVELHGGTITAESREGSGARFHFSLNTSPCPDPGQS